MGAATGGQYGAQGTDTFGNPQAPVSGGAVYNADGQSVGTGSGAGIGSTTGAGHHSHGSGTGMGTDSSNNSSGELMLSAVLADICLALELAFVVALPAVRAGSVGCWPVLSFCHVLLMRSALFLRARTLFMGTHSC